MPSNCCHVFYRVPVAKLKRNGPDLVFKSSRLSGPPSIRISNNERSSPLFRLRERSSNGSFECVKSISFPDKVQIALDQLLNLWCCVFYSGNQSTGQVISEVFCDSCQAAYPVHSRKKV